MAGRWSRSRTWPFVVVVAVATLSVVLTPVGSLAQDDGGAPVDPPPMTSPEPGREPSPGRPGSALVPQTGVPFDVVDASTGLVVRPDQVRALVSVDLPDAGTPQSIELAELPADGRIEISELGSETSTVFLNADGSLTEEVSVLPERVSDGAGGFEPIDLRLEVQEGAKVAAAAGLTQVEIDAVPSRDEAGRSWLASVSIGGERLELGIDGEVAPGVLVDKPATRARDNGGAIGTRQPIVGVGEPAGGDSRPSARNVLGGDRGVVANERSVRFGATGATFAGVDVEPALGGVKFSYEVASLRDAEGPIEETLRLPDGWRAVQRGVVVDLVDGEGVAQAVWAGGEMFDSAGGDELASGYVAIELRSVEDGVVTALLRPDREWLADPGRVWPVFIDPTLGYQWSASVDTTVWQGDAGPNNTWTTMWAGERTTPPNCSGGQPCQGDGPLRALVKFPWSRVGKGYEIDSATLTLHHIKTERPSAPSQNCPSTNVTVRRILDFWDSNNEVWLATEPVAVASTTAGQVTTLVDGRHPDHATMSGCSQGSGSESWDVTDIVQWWSDNATNADDDPATYQGFPGSDFYGFYVYSTPATEEGSTQFASANNSHAANHPKLVIRYVGAEITAHVAGDSDFHSWVWPDTGDGIVTEVTATNVSPFAWDSDVCAVLRLTGPFTTGNYSGSCATNTPPGASFTGSVVVTTDGYHPPGVYNLIPDWWEAVTGGSISLLETGASLGPIIRFRVSEPPATTAPPGLILATQDFDLEATLPHAGTVSEWVPDGYRFVVVPEGVPCAWDAPGFLWRFESTQMSSPAVTLPKTVFQPVSSFAWCIAGYDDDLHSSYRWSDFSAAQVVDVFQPGELSAAGFDRSGGFVDGVNTVIGNYVRSWTDISVATPGPGLGVTRTFNSTDAVDIEDAGAFGPYFQFNYDLRLDIESPTRVTVVQPDGRHDTFTRDNASDPFEPPLGSTATLTEAQGSYGLALANQTGHVFDSTGQLVSTVDRDGHELTFAYDGAGKLQTATDQASGRAITFVWSGDRIVTASVPDPDGGSTPLAWNYYYEFEDPQGGSDPARLRKVCDPRSTTPPGFDQDDVESHPTLRCWSYVWTNGELTQIVNPSGFVDSNGVLQTPAETVAVELVYDQATGQIAELMDAEDLRLGNNHKTNYSWSQNPTTGEITAVATRNPGKSYEQVTTHIFDAQLRLVSETTPGAAAPILYRYNDDGLRDQITDAATRVSDLSYDDDRRLEWLRNAANEYTYYRYDADGNRTHVCDGRSAGSADNTFCTVTTYVDDQVTSVVQPLQALGERWEYTDGNESAIGGGTVPAGLVLWHRSALGAQTDYEYDSAGDLRRTTNQASGRVDEYTYDGLGRVLTHTVDLPGTTDDPVTTTTYDAVGNVVTVLEPAVNNTLENASHQLLTTYDYDHNDNVSSVVLSDAGDGGVPVRSTTFDYDELDREVEVIDPEGGTLTRQFDQNGNVTAVTDPNGNDPTNPSFGASTQTTYYSDDGRAHQVISHGVVLDPDQPTSTVSITQSTTTYDNVGRVRTVTDANGVATETQYDDADRPVKVWHVDVLVNAETSPRNVRVRETVYDEAGNPIWVYEGGDIDDVNQSTATRVTHFEYDDAGRVHKTWLIFNGRDPITLDSDDRVTTFDYDDAGNVLSVEVSQHGETARTTNVYDTAGRLTRSWDENNNNTSEDAAFDLITTYGGYDVWGNPGWMTPPNGNAAGATPADHRISYAYDSLGRLETTTSPTVAVTTVDNSTDPPTVNQDVQVAPQTVIGYDAFGAITHTRDERGNVTTTTYDLAGRPVTIAHPDYTQPFAISPQQPESFAGANAATETFGYDANGNLTSQTSRRGHTTDFVFNSLNQVLTQTDPLVSGETGRGVWETAYNTDGTVAATTDPTGAVLQFGYDDLGRQTERVESVRDVTITTTTGGGGASGALDVLLVVEDPASMTSSDSAIDTNMTSSGHTVTLWDDDTAAPTSGYDVVVLAASSTTGTDYTTSTMPVIALNKWDYQNLGIASPKYGYPGDHTITIDNPSHAAAGGLTGTFTALNAALDMRTWLTSELGTGAVVVASSNALPALWVYDDGAILRNGSPADERRVGFGLGNWGASGLTATGWDLFDAALEWAADASAGGSGTTTNTVVSGGVFTTTYTYNDLGSVTAVTDPETNTTQTDYNPAQEAIKVTDPDLHETEFEYNLRGDVTKVTDPAGRITVTGFDQAGRATSTALYANAAELNLGAYEWQTTADVDADGNVTSATDAEGHETTYDYDGLGRLSSVGQEGQVITPGTIQMDVAFVVADDTSLTSSETAVEAHLLGEGHTVTPVDDGDPVVTSGYDIVVVSGSAVTGTNYTGVSVPVLSLQTQYTSAGNGDVTITNPTHAATGPLSGTITAVSAGIVRTWSPSFLAATDATVVAESAGDPTAIVYEPTDHMGAGIYATERAGGLAIGTNASNLTNDGWALFDAMAIWTANPQPAGGGSQAGTLYDFSYRYDEAGNVTAITDGRNNPWYYTYNPWGLQEATIEPNTSTNPASPTPLSDRQYVLAYDAGGLPAAELLAGGVAVASSYDQLGRRTQLGSGTLAETAGFDLVGRQTSTSHPAGSQEFIYDDRGLVVGSTGPAGNTIYGYDDAGRLTDRDDVAGIWSFAYTNRSELAQLIDPITGLTVDYVWNPDGTVHEADHGTAGVRAYGYDEAGRLHTDTWTVGTTTVYSATYTYYADGNIDTETITGTGTGDGVWDYDYDEANRLTSWTHDSTTTAVTWDANGNRTSHGSDAFSYDARNRLETSPAGTHTWTPRGTLDQIIGSGGADFDFDDLGRLTQTTPDSQAPISYTYDGLDRVAARNSVPFAYNAGAIDPVSIGSDAYGRNPAGSLVAIDETLATVAVRDRHGDVVASVDTTGNLVSSAAYDPFGEAYATTGATPALGYQADYTDPDTDDVWMGARWYAPSTATFRSRDTVFGELQTPISLNRYTYAIANPIAYWDPDGRCVMAVFDFCLDTITVGGKASYLGTHRVSGGSGQFGGHTNIDGPDVSIKGADVPETTTVAMVLIADVALTEHAIVLHACASIECQPNVGALTPVGEKRFVGFSSPDLPWEQHYSLDNGLTTITRLYDENGALAGFRSSLGGGGTATDTTFNSLLEQCIGYDGEALECVAADALLAGASLEDVKNWLPAACRNNEAAACFYNSGGVIDWTDEFLAYAEAPFILRSALRIGARSFARQVAEEAPRTIVGAGEDIVGTGHGTLRPTQDWISRSAVDDYAVRLQAGETLPAIDVQRLPDGREFILDGHHRYVASQQTGIPVDINYVDGVGPVGLPDWAKVIYEP